MNFSTFASVFRLAGAHVGDRGFGGTSFFCLTPSVWYQNELAFLDGRFLLLSQVPDEHNFKNRENLFHRVQV
jgi:hypothetical protein